jgi:predicted RNase H-like HicB family nuclease
MTVQYGVVLEDGEDGWIVARVPSLPGVVTQGRTREEALANAREAIELTLEDMKERGETIPPADLGAELVEVAA